MWCGRSSVYVLSLSPGPSFCDPSPFAPRDHRGYLTYDAVKRMREDMRVREVLADEFEQLLKDR